jgi:large subunit ribosomal protein L13
MDKLTYTIDASGRTLGRVASEAAQALQGKKSAHFARNVVLNLEVIIENAKKLNISEKRAAGKVYTHYTGFPGGLREATMKEVMQKKGVAEVLRKTVDGMIPRNKLRKERMKRLIIKD